ncbi:2-succinylbenzoate--CoA ligase-like [Physella acuta]|uniref:2-succinylbenzoate--CoA ligase-like n=1 Tax=Physella acuta TaxID=109671 RepID=UPI0027DC626F|nr:2-succinylbenzoate--CoA ligase-like [Physella acuta]XP_059170966.1 2-succinylbenzoate--CoA ligase-like [Physella acuta]
MAQNIPTDIVIERLKYRAQQDPSKAGYIFLTFQNELLPLSRFELWNLSGRFASRLRRLGIKIGDVVCSILNNSRTKLITDLGIMTAGGVVINAKTILSDGQDVFKALNISKCRTIITSRDCEELLFLQTFFKTDGLKRQVGVETIIPVQCSQAPCLKQLIVYKLTSHQDHTAFISSLADEDFYEADVNADDEAYIFLTSGSTSYSKLVPRTQREYLAQADAIKHFGQLTDVMYNDRPMEWIAGSPHLYLSAGVTTVVQEVYDGVVKRRVTDIWQLLSHLGVHLAFMLPADVMELKQAYDNGCFHQKISALITGGQPIRKKLFDVVGRVFEKVYTIYGSTDAGFLVTGVVDHTNRDQIKDCYTGQCLTTGLQMKLLDEKTNTLVTSANKVGKIFCRGGNVLRHYLGMERSTQGVFTEDNWFVTSDLGYTDEVGDLHVIGRTSDSILNGTTIVYPQWLEERLHTCPGVENVVVVGEVLKEWML